MLASQPSSLGSQACQKRGEAGKGAADTCGQLSTLIPVHPSLTRTQAIVPRPSVCSCSLGKPVCRVRSCGFVGFQTHVVLFVMPHGKGCPVIFHYCRQDTEQEIYRLHVFKCLARRFCSGQAGGVQPPSNLLMFCS